MRSRVLLRAAMVVAAAAVLIGSLGPDLGVGRPTTSVIAPAHAAAGAELQSLDRAVQWLNSPPLDANALRGKVILVDFWTYTCINWLRTLPYVRAWADKYRSQGLVVVGVHTPEFSFEGNIANVSRSTKELKVGFPVAVDSRHGIWNGFGNQYWPAVYLVDAQGRVRFRHFGEGEYEKTERMIQQLLAEAGNSGVAKDVTAVEGKGLEAAADWGNLRSPENYLGADRTDNFASPGGAAVNKRRVYAAPATLRVNQWALSGDWTMGKEATRSNQPNSRLVYRFHARDVHLVMGPAKPGEAVRFRVLVDGQPPAAARGLDVDAQGHGTAKEQRLYQLLRQPGQVSDRSFEIRFLDPGVEVFAFTFG